MTHIPAEGPLECDLVIHNGYVITMNAERSIYPDGAVAIQGGKIAAVGPGKEIKARYRGKSVIDAHSAPVHPGLVECHYHVPNQLTRGVFPDAPTTKQYYLYYAHWYDRMDAEDEHAAALHAGLEMLRSGTTTFLEPGTVFDTDAVADAATSLGIRASLAEPFLWDTGEDATLSNMDRATGGTKRCMDLLGRELWRNRDDDALVRGHVCLFGSGSASDEVTLAAVEMAERAGVVFNQHQSTSVKGVAVQEQRLGQAPLVHFAEAGILRPHCSFTHMNFLRPQEAEVVRESGMSLIWCPANSMNWGFGASGARRPHPELYRQGVNVGLGADVAKWGLDTSPMVAYLLARDLGTVAPLTVEEIFEMATVGGARALRMEDRIGSLEPGKHADIVIRTADLPEMQPALSVIQSMMLASRGKSVDMVIVNGQVVVSGGHSTRVDEQSVFRRAREVSTTLAAAIDVRPDTTWPEVP